MDDTEMVKTTRCKIPISIMYIQSIFFPSKNCCVNFEIIHDDLVNLCFLLSTLYFGNSNTPARLAKLRIRKYIRPRSVQIYLNIFHTSYHTLSAHFTLYTLHQYCIVLSYSSIKTKTLILL